MIGFVHRIFLTCFMRKDYLLCYGKADNVFDTHFEINMHILALFFTEAISDTPASLQPHTGKEVAAVCQTEMLHLKGLLSSPASILCRELMKHFSSLAIFHLQIGTVLPQEKNTLLKKGLLSKSFCLVMICKKKKKSQRKYLSRSKIIFFFLNNNNVSHW